MGCSFKIDHFKHISPEFIMRDLLSLETLRSSLDLKQSSESLNEVRNEDTRVLSLLVYYHCLKKRGKD